MRERKDFRFRFPCLDAGGGPHQPLTEGPANRLTAEQRPHDENGSRRGYYAGRIMRGRRSQHPPATDYLYAERFIIPHPPLAHCIPPPYSKEFMLVRQRVTRCISPKEQATRWVSKQQASRCHPKSREMQLVQRQSSQTSQDIDEFSLFQDLEEVTRYPSKNAVTRPLTQHHTRCIPQPDDSIPPRQQYIQPDVSNPSFRDGRCPSQNEGFVRPSQNQRYEHPSQNEGFDRLSPIYSRYFPQSHDPGQLHVQGDRYSPKEGGFRPRNLPDTCHQGYRYSRYKDTRCAPQSESVTLRQLSKQDTRVHFSTESSPKDTDGLAQSLLNTRADNGDPSLGYHKAIRPSIWNIDGGQFVLVDKPSSEVLDINTQAPQIDDCDSCLSDEYETDSFYSTDIEFVAGSDKGKRESNFMRLLRKFKNAVFK